MTPLDSKPGTYALLLQAERLGPIDVGRLGTLTIQSGAYVYVGSALGPGGLQARVSRHARQEKPRRWHVDYLRAVTELAEVWYTVDEVRRECQWSAAIRKLPELTVPLVGFGSSDCRCDSHLVHFRGEPSIAMFRSRLKRAFPDHGRVRCQAITQIADG